MRAWRSPKGLLFDRGPTQEPVIDSLVSDLPEGPPRELHEFLLIDADGIVRNTFRVTVWSVEDELGVSVHAVTGGALRDHTVRQHHGANYRVKRSEQVVLGDLQQIPADDAESWDRIRDAMLSHQRLAEQHADQRKREAARRIADIPGASEDHQVGPEFRRAQELLCGRVGSHGDSLEIELLRTLLRFGRMHRSFRESARPGSAPPAAFVAAAEAFVLACKRRAFDPSLKEKDRVAASASELPGDFGGLSTTEQADLRDLGETLAALEHELRKASEGQDECDARLNAIEFRKAAGHVARARGHLDRGLRQDR